MLNKILREKYIDILVSILFGVIACLGFFYLGIIYNDKSNSKDVAKDYNKVITQGLERDNVYVSVKFNSLPTLLVTEDSGSYTNKYYLLVDENKYMYIAKLNDNSFNKIKKNYKKNIINFSYTLKGYIYNAPKDLKNEIIKLYNQSNSEKINLDSYSRYFGNTYLDDTYTKYTTRTAISIIVIIISLIVSIVVFIKWLIFMVNTNKMLKNISKNELEEELKNCNINKYKKAKIYLTDNYFISTYKGLHVYRYSDIKWVFQGNQDKAISFSIGNKINLNVNLSNKKRYETKCIDTIYFQLFVDIISSIIEKNSDVLAGYTYENMTAYNKYNN